jgi:phage-related protein
VTTVPTAIEPVATPVPAGVGAITPTVQACIGTLATALQVVGDPRVAQLARPSCAAVVAVFDAVAPVIQALLQAIPLPVQPMVDAVADVPGVRSADGARQQ